MHRLPIEITVIIALVLFFSAISTGSVELWMMFIINLALIIFSVVKNRE